MTWSTELSRQVRAEFAAAGRRHRVPEPQDAPVVSRRPRRLHTSARIVTSRERAERVSAEENAHGHER